MTPLWCRQVIFRKACDFREIKTVLQLALCLLLRTLGSLWVAKHWCSFAHF
jgi:hypothetical protein